ncbi:hypothetical protein M1146_06015, partial [Patescibacteria group bacterium]|nr:hypothetical protein [Patescibacteria group bacterium]
MKKCDTCGRLTCGYYTLEKVAPCGHSDPSDTGDYPAWYCTYCYELRFGKYLKDFEAEEARHDQFLEDFETRIKHESLTMYTLEKVAPCGHSDPSDTGDYPAWYCTYCYELRFGKYLKDFE